MSGHNELIIPQELQNIIQCQPVAKCNSGVSINKIRKNCHFFHQVLQVDEDGEDQDFYLQFMKKSGTGSLYVWPEQPDKAWQPDSDVLCVLSAPPTLTNCRQQFQFKPDDIANIERLCAKYTKIHFK